MKGVQLKVDYSKYTAWLKCSKCQDGKVEYIHIERGSISEIEIKNCNVCKKFYGIKAAQKLELIEVVS